MEHPNSPETTAIVEADEPRPLTPTENLLAPLELADLSQFLYSASFGGKQTTDFTSEGIKVLGLREGISTGDVRVEFLDDSKTEALFFCTATDAKGHTSSVVVKQSEREGGRVNKNWIETGCSRAIRNSLKARLPVGLLKAALQRAIAAGEAKQSAIVEVQKQLGQAWEARDKSLSHIDKKSFFRAAQDEFGDSEMWDADTWHQVREDLTAPAEWVKKLGGMRYV